MKDFLKSYEGKKITLVDITPFNEDLTLSEVKDSYFVITTKDWSLVYPYIRIVSIFVDNKTNSLKIHIGSSADQSLRKIADGLYSSVRFGPQKKLLEK